MAALEALVGGKMKIASEQKSQKQTNRMRLIAGPSITATALQLTFTNFLNYKGHKNLWLVVAPPPSGPSSYGWHTNDVDGEGFRAHIRPDGPQHQDSVHQAHQSSEDNV